MGFAKTIQIALSKLIHLPISKSDSAFGHARERHDPRKNDIFVFPIYTIVNSTFSAIYVLYSVRISAIEASLTSNSLHRASSCSLPELCVPRSINHLLPQYGCKNYKNESTTIALITMLTYNSRLEIPCQSLIG